MKPGMMQLHLLCMYNTDLRRQPTAAPMSFAEGYGTSDMAKSCTKQATYDLICTKGTAKHFNYSTFDVIVS